MHGVRLVTVLLLRFGGMGCYGSGVLLLSSGVALLWFRFVPARGGGLSTPGRSRGPEGPWERPAGSRGAAPPPKREGECVHHFGVGLSFMAQRISRRHLEGDTDPDDATAAFDALADCAKHGNPATQLQQLRRSLGGIKLCFQLMPSMLLDMCKIMYVVMSSSWDWYTFQIEKIKSPPQKLMQSLDSPLAWQRDEHLQAMIR